MTTDVVQWLCANWTSQNVKIQGAQNANRYTMRSQWQPS